jgi:enamine deaminase RidA (YjgF/YER057c/UK114 family)
LRRSHSLLSTSVTAYDPVPSGPDHVIAPSRENGNYISTAAPQWTTGRLSYQLLTRSPLYLSSVIIAVIWMCLAKANRRNLPLYTAQAVISRGHVYVSGNIGCDKNLKVVEGGVAAQTVCSGT